MTKKEEFEHCENMPSFRCNKGAWHAVELDNNDWIVSTVFNEKSIEDYPWVEVRDNKKSRWQPRQYLYTDETNKYWVIDKCINTIIHFNYMRQIKPVDIEELKQKARLV